MDAIQEMQALVASGKCADRCPPCPPQHNPRFWRTLWAQLRRGAKALVDAAESYPIAAVGGCGGGCGSVCGGGACSVCGPSPNYGSTVDHMLGRVPRDYAIPEAAKWDREVARRCLQVLKSPLTVIPAGGAATDVPVEPESGCFVALWRKVFAIDDANPQTEVIVEVGPSFIGQCPTECSTEFGLSIGYDTDDCMGCPVPMLEIGLTALRKQAHMNVRTLNPGGAARVQVWYWGLCYPESGCARFCANGNGMRRAA